MPATSRLKLNAVQKRENARRAKRAATALAAYADGDDRGAPVVDLLADIRHYCAKHDLDFEREDALANGHFAAEIRGED